MPRSAGGIDETHFAVPERLNRRRQRTIENEGLHESRCLEQRVSLTDRLGQVLVKVSEESCVERLIDEVVDDLAAVGIDPLPELDERARRIGRQRQAPERVVTTIEQRRCGP